MLSLQDLSKAGVSFKKKKRLTCNALLFVNRSLNVEKRRLKTQLDSILENKTGGTRNKLGHHKNIT